MEQKTKEQAIAFAQSGVWKEMSHKEIVRLQLFQDLMCVPFGRYHEALTSVLGRSVFTHELSSSNYESMVKEYLGMKDAPTLNEIINLIPEDKRLIIGV